MELSELLENKKNIKIKLNQIRRQTLQLENELKITEENIFQKCNHIWISQGRLYKYGDISYVCSICGSEK